MWDVHMADAEHPAMRGKEDMAQGEETREGSIPIPPRRTMQRRGRSHPALCKSIGNILSGVFSCVVQGGP